MLGLKVNDVTIRRAAARQLGDKRQLDAMQDLQDVAKNDVNAGAAAATPRRASTSSSPPGADPSATPEQKLAAVTKLGEMQSIRALDLIKTEAAKPGLSAEVSATYVRRSRRSTVTCRSPIGSRTSFGLSAGSIFVLLALGLAITFGLMGVINMAHGEMLMIGAVSTWACYEYIGKHLPPAWFDWYYVIAFPVSFLIAALVGLVIEYTIVRHLYNRPLDSLLATIGVSYILIQAVRNWKSDNLGMQKPAGPGGNWEIFQDVNLPYNRLFLIVLTIFCIVGVLVLFNYTRLGLMIRATVQNPRDGAALGVNTRLRRYGHRSRSVPVWPVWRAMASY